MDTPCPVCEEPVADEDSYVLLARSRTDRLRVHERCLATIRRTGPWPEPGRMARLSRQVRPIARRRLVPDLEDLEQTLRDRSTLDPRIRAELMNALMTPDYERASWIGDYWLDPRSRTFAELLIDAEESPATRGVLIGMLREGELRG